MKVHGIGTKVIYYASSRLHICKGITEKSWWYYTVLLSHIQIDSFSGGVMHKRTPCIIIKLVGTWKKYITGFN